MCLLVKNVPANRSTFLIGAGIKFLRSEIERYSVPLRRGYRTPYQDVYVPSDGWLLPYRPRIIKPNYLESVYDGVIHFYSENYSPSDICSFKCYAFGIVGYSHSDFKGIYCEAAAYALYIQLPHHGDRVARKIRSMMDGEVAASGVTATKLVEAFPKLASIKKHLQSYGNNSVNG